MKFNAKDEQALRALATGFAIDGEIAVIAGEMEIMIERPAEDRYKMTIGFPNNEKFDILISRAKTLEQFDIAGES
jgi:hypothetical protein